VSKIGRNQPCPCGSGKKYKRCHGALASPAENEAPIDRAASFARIALMRHEARQKEIEKQFGLGRPPISFESHGYKLVAVGPEIHWSPHWKTFPDFLMDYFKKVMGADWGGAELAKPRDQWHPLFAWYAMTCEYQKKVIAPPGQPALYPVTGAACGIMWLTYGLYLLRHNADIQSRLLHRLRACDPVQIFGALYEVIIAAAMIRAGFELELENEADGSDTHCEFTATSKITCQRFSVEVKVCDPGRAEDSDGRPRTLRQLSRALAKTANHPRIVCIDLNRPMPASATPQDIETLLRQEMSRIRRQENTLQIRGKPAPPAYVALSNYPFRFDLEGTRIPRGALLEGFKIPQLVSGAPFASLRKLAEFHAEHADPLRFAKTFTEMQIPSTLDGELPSKAFGEKGAPILIGERYLVPDVDGREVAGELVSAVVMETQMSVVGIVRLDDGPHVTVNMPITEHELNLYKESPDTFFGVYEPTTRVKHPVELYELFLSIYSQTARDRLLEFLAAHPNIEALRELPQLELAKIYAEGLANNIVWKEQSPSIIQSDTGQYHT
jgi:SEC-C motif